MVTNNNLTLKNALKEVDYIIQNLPLGIQKKIPSDFRKSIVENMNESYVPNAFDENKSLEEQNILDETKLILAAMYRDYIVSDEERDNLVIEENKIKQKLEEKKREIYNPNSLFKNNTNQEKTKTDEFSTEICESKKKGFFSMIFNMINNLFK